MINYTKNFGKDIPAIGMAYYMDNILKAIERVGEKMLKIALTKGRIEKI